jgi:hypothetical protein
MNFILNWKKQIKNQENLNVFSCLYYSSQTIEETLDENENKIGNILRRGGK